MEPPHNRVVYGFVEDNGFKGFKRARGRGTAGFALIVRGGFVKFWAACLFGKDGVNKSGTLEIDLLSSQVVFVNEEPCWAIIADTSRGQFINLGKQQSANLICGLHGGTSRGF